MMRVLWLSPWMRSLARVHVEALAERGADVMLVTTDQHPQSDTAREYEAVLNTRLKDPDSWRQFLHGWRAATRFSPDVVVAELVRDPRWMAFGALAPRVQLIHDDRPHDDAEQRPAPERIVFDRWAASSVATVAFSEYVAAAIRDRPDVRHSALTVIPLTSDLPADLVPEPSPAHERHDFVLLGRLNAYKNIEVVFESWHAHVGGPDWRGDELILIGDGQLSDPLPSHTRWIRGPYSYPDVLEQISHAKGSIAHYRRATQSGVQVLSMQLGVTPIVSREGALPEFQPPHAAPVGVDDVVGLTATLDRLADPAFAASSGAASADHYRDHYPADRAAGLFMELFDRVGVANPAPNRPTQNPVRNTSG
ncbi:hypothetical protein ABIC28_002289 [Rhodococcus sp. PvR044]|jgi:hypothetical protein|uniref:hypothetical protein n=1 Tax=unclassified Rhodococcus (in: high G+C Gram-positive bacteria) TaxID=192944 RepID=UPI000BD88CE2|nr:MULTISPECIES: hypothetical protein [unclassified Rhodococcus (in: high G+C Gram-positive bacteria)]PTR42821.1 glycosyltransferase involved in cell wall biosynthesis [Rhodococcus sp. OK611]SNX91822.1 Glycosyltransferase involved in cell wall bisynthesis [Rhodococcus sp. OK270]